ncbi:MAG: hypothetical protein C5B53_10150 [Candidatus Melainabacteria bacterium]|nr:MAG: hypothetical protein C5B53_10150 [Candidatus Melainabacteria bacterium]
MRSKTTGILCALVTVTCFIPRALADRVIDADNTKQNADYRNAPTAQDQSNEKSQVEQTAEMRRALMKEKGLSVNAQNIKIVSEQGQVFLRGPVDNSREKQIIDALANHCFGSNYKNELQVKEGK